MKIETNNIRLQLCQRLGWLTIGFCWLLIGAPAYALPSGCGVIPPHAIPFSDSHATLTVGGTTVEADTERTYAIDIPADYNSNTSTPLVILPHHMVNDPDGTGHPYVNINNSWNIQLDPDPIVLRPQALVLPGSLVNRSWNLNLYWSDMEFFKALTDYVRTNYCIDEARVIYVGQSGGGFGAQGGGCFTHASAVVSDRGGILHPPYAVENFGFPDMTLAPFFWDEEEQGTPVPPTDLCGPIPALLGFSIMDEAVTMSDIGDPSIDWWVQNNECDGIDDYAYDDDATSQVCNWTGENCICNRHNNCAKDLVVCTWDNENGHGTSEIGQLEAAWWLSEQAPNNSQPILHIEPFDNGIPTHAWTFSQTSVAFDIFPLADKERIHMVVPISPVFHDLGHYGEVRLDADYWDGPIPQDFTAGVTVTNLKGFGPEARLVVEKEAETVEIRTYFLGLQLRARAYLNGIPQGNSWRIHRKIINGSRLHNGACWMIRAEPIDDMVRIYSSAQIDWPECSGKWIERAAFDNPFADHNPYDTTLNVYFRSYRNKRTEKAENPYIRFDDFKFARSMYIEP